MDVALHLNDGSVIEGTIVELVPYESVTIRTGEGSVLVVHKDQIIRITKPEGNYISPSTHEETYPSQKTGGKSTVMGLKAGWLSSGTQWVGDYELESKSSYSLGGFVDGRLAPRLFGGLAFDYHGDLELLNFSVTMKGLISGRNGRFSFKPGFMIGYGTVKESTQFFTVGGLAELEIPIQSPLSFIAEFGIYAAPLGGNADYDITFGPLFLLRGGIAF